jgi:hypothetical protein
LSFSEEELRRKRTGVLATTFPPAWRKPDADATRWSRAFCANRCKDAPR